MAIRKPRPAILLCAVFSVVALALLPGMTISTSRYAMVGDDDPYQQRLMRYFERFGFPDAPIIVVSGGTPMERRRVVDAMRGPLEAEPELANRVLAQVNPSLIAEVLLLQQPEKWAGVLADKLPAGTDVGALLEGGLPVLLEGLEEELLRGFGAGKVPEDGAQQLAVLAALAEALDWHLQGREGEAWGRVMALAPDAVRGSGGQRNWGIDEAGYLAGSTGQHHLIALFPDIPGDELDDLLPVVERVRTIRDEVLAQSQFAGTAVSVRVTGIPALTVDEMNVIRDGLLFSTLAATIGILALLWFGFRSVTQTLVGLVPLGLGVLLTLGVVRVLYGGLNLITSNMVAVLLGLGIAFGVHTVWRYNEFLMSGREPVGSARQGVASSGPGIVTGGVTTALAFLTVLTTEFTAYAELGVLTAVGLMLILVCTFAIMPPLLVWCSHRGVGGQVGVRRQVHQIPVFCHLPGLVRRSPTCLLMAGAVTAVAGGLVLGTLKFNVRYFDFLPRTTESAQGLRALESDGAMSPTFATLSGEGLAQTRERVARLRAMPEVSTVHTATDLLPKQSPESLAALSELLQLMPPQSALAATASDEQPAQKTAASAAELAERAKGIAALLKRSSFFMQMRRQDPKPAKAAAAAFTGLQQTLTGLPNDGRDTLLRFDTLVKNILGRAVGTARAVVRRGDVSVEDLPAVFKIRFLSGDSQHLAMFAYPKGDIWDRAIAANFARAVETVDPQAAGVALSLQVHSEMVLSGFKRAAWISAALVFLVLLIDFRRLRDALLALLPVVVGWLWMMGLMGLAGLDFNVANIVTLPLLLGIGIDAGVHMVHRTRQSADEHGGVAKLDELLQGTGSAVLLASLTTMAGFAALTISDHRAMISLGVLMVLGVGACLLASVVILPALLVRLGLAR